MENLNINIPPEKPLSKKEIKKEKKLAKKQAKAKKKENRSKLSKSDVMGILLIVVLVAVAVALFFVCKDASKSESLPSGTVISTTAQPVVQTTVPVTVPTTVAPPTAPVTTETTTETTTSVPATETTEAEKETTESKETTEPQETTASQQTTETKPAEPSDAEILDIITGGINSLQSDTASFIGTKTQVIDIKLNDCSVPFLTDTVNKVLEFFAGEEVLVYDFTDGKAIDPEEGTEVSTIHMIPPTDKYFTLTIDGVADASVTKNEKGTVYSVTVVPETSTLADPRPPHHNAAGDTLDFSAFELPVGEVTKADFNYPGATVGITLDESGRVVEYHERLEMSGFGEGKALGITASGDMEGYIDEHWAIQWK